MISVERKNDSVELRTQVGEEVNVIIANKVILAIPGTKVLGLLKNPSPKEVAFFSTIRFASTIVASYLVNRSPFQGATSVWFPQIENQVIASLMISPQNLGGKHLITLACHDEAAQDLMKQDDRVVIATLTAELEKYLTGEPEFLKLQRWADAIPLFKTGYITDVIRFENSQLETSDILFAGDSLGGPYIDGALLSGEKAATKILQSSLQKKELTK